LSTLKPKHKKRHIKTNTQPSSSQKQNNTNKQVQSDKEVKLIFIVECCQFVEQENRANASQFTKQQN